MPRLFAALEIPHNAAMSLVTAARRIAGRPLDRHRKLSSDIALHRRCRTSCRRRVRRCARADPALRVQAGPVRARMLRRQEAAFTVRRADRLARPDRVAGRNRADLPAARLPADPRKFTPHVTIARLRNVQPEMAARYLSSRGNFHVPPFTVGRFVLMSSRESIGGGPYIVEDSYPLTPRSAVAPMAKNVAAAVR
jgi:2'-5' RNA ligase